ncbi:MAG: hypothetical protein ACJA08_000741 [Cyclobacteriaceae bacterium]|jgi:hypothetical protein
MRKRLKERLKDTVIDHIFVTGFEKIFQRQEISIENRKMWFGPMEKKFVRLYENENRVLLEKDLMNRLKHRDLNFHPIVFRNVLIDLIIKGFIIEGAPCHEEYGLTVKGVNHYQSGRSFEESYVKDRITRIAIWISVGSTFIALFSLLKAFDFLNFSICV